MRHPVAGSAGRRTTTGAGWRQGSKLEAGLKTGLFSPPLVPICHIVSIVRLEKVLNHPIIFQT